MAIKVTDLHWAAGFIEGEGCFTASKIFRGNINVGANQVQREPLDRLARMFGGNFRRRPYSRPQQDQWQWTLSGVAAVGLMQTLYPLMSPKRQQRILECLGLWKTWGVLGKYKNCCKRGHPLSGDNLIVRSNGRAKRGCRTCARMWWRQYSAERRSFLKKLDAEKVRAMREQVANGMPQTEAARHYGVAYVTVNKIIQRKIWKSI